MSDERRERWRAALGYMHGINPEPYIDAAMAVADKEIAEYLDAHSEWKAGVMAELARLRAQLDYATERREHHWEEVKRLRAENAELHRYHREDQDALAEMRATIEGMRAELARVGDLQASEAEIVAAPLRADRAAVLREAADAVALFTGNELDTNAKMLRRLADEAQEGES